MGVMETKAEKSRMEQVRRQLGFECGFVVERNGKLGGLALWQNRSSNVTVQSYLDYHIDAVFEEECTFRVTLFYGHPMAQVPRGRSHP
ncbi:hypothetical protein QQ045_014500 [Rhodiola kirilowii]